MAATAIALNRFGLGARSSESPPADADRATAGESSFKGA
jgi:hypothetical protein